MIKLLMSSGPWSSFLPCSLTSFRRPAPHTVQHDPWHTGGMGQHAAAESGLPSGPRPHCCGTEQQVPLKGRLGDCGDPWGTACPNSFLRETPGRSQGLQLSGCEPYHKMPS